LFIVQRIVLKHFLHTSTTVFQLLVACDNFHVTSLILRNIQYTSLETFSKEQILIRNCGICNLKGRHFEH